MAARSVKLFVVTGSRRIYFLYLKGFKTVAILISSAALCTAPHIVLTSKPYHKI